MLKDTLMIELPVLREKVNTILANPEIIHIHNLTENDRLVLALWLTLERMK
jgi:hypothetical protein